MSTQAVRISVKGQVQKPGSYLAAAGENLLDAVFAHGGGLAHPRFVLKAVLVGGARGRFAGPDELQQPLAQSDEIMVFDSGSCLVNVVRLLLLYNLSQPSGYRGCAACRAALAAAAGILARLSTPRATVGDVAKLKELAAAKDENCPDRCSALAPLTSALANWEAEFTEHALGRCPASICADLMVVPCANSCPAGVDLPGTVALAQLGRYTDAVALGRHDNPFFLTCGHVCEDPLCQTNCKRLHFDDAVYSQSLHRYAGEKAAQAAGGLQRALAHPTIIAGPASGKKVAVVGAGPSGLAAAAILARLGHKVAVYDKNPLPGGMAVFGIPAYRLPRSVVAAEIESILTLGVELHTGRALGRDLTLPGLRAEYDAVLLAIGSGRGRSLGVPGENLPGVVSAIGFLREVALTGKAEVGARVLVVGGGNVAVDAARTALRLGAEKAVMMCVEDKFEMPASAGEVAAALAEGVTLRVLAVPTAFSGEERVAKATFVNITPGPYDTLGRRWPPLLRRDEAEERDFDTVIVAIGQAAELECLAGSGVDRRGPYIACHDGNATSLAGVFAAGDCTGPLNSVVKAVGHGKAAAYAVDRYLTGAHRPLTSSLRGKLAGCRCGYTAATARRVDMPEQDAASRVGNFDPVELGLDDARAGYEMLRCICAAKDGQP